MAQTHQFCTFYLDKLMFGVELQKVQEVLRNLELTGIPLAPEVVSGLMNLRGQIITAIDLRRRLELTNRPEGMLPMNVVVRSDDGAISLLVDEIGDVVTRLVGLLLDRRVAGLDALVALERLGAIRDICDPSTALGSPITPMAANRSGRWRRARTSSSLSPGSSVRPAA